jgi:hypothetical protein
MRRAVGIGLDVVVAVLVLATLALPLGAMAAADRLPTPPRCSPPRCRRWSTVTHSRSG